MLYSNVGTTTIGLWAEAIIIHMVQHHGGNPLTLACCTTAATNGAPDHGRCGHGGRLWTDPDPCYLPTAAWKAHYLGLELGAVKDLRSWRELRVRTAPTTRCRDHGGRRWRAPHHGRPHPCVSYYGGPCSLTLEGLILLEQQGSATRSQRGALCFFKKWPDSCIVKSFDGRYFSAKRCARPRTRAVCYLSSYAQVFLDDPACYSH
mmetsp:Transcript_40804/g.91967  ORF Transcript_40804/g.91967 Transcript_40804/m.91967 type:complete len:205 (-) Transcript_40804:177-791(-)